MVRVKYGLGLPASALTEPQKAARVTRNERWKVRRRRVGKKNGGAS